MYYVYKTCGYVVKEEHTWKGFLDTYSPPVMQSAGWKHWVTTLDARTCLICRDNHGRIFSLDENPEAELPVHPNCRCEVQIMNAVLVGNGTKDGQNGADWWIENFGVLPDYYIMMDDIRKIGWREGKSPVKYAPGKMITRGVYENNNGHLPDAPGRIWYEADINYYEGRRNGHRILWSNDGLIFVTYDHYKTFYEITGGIQL